MRYLNILLACAAEPWALQPEKLEAICQFLAFKAQGGDFAAEEIEARIGKGQERQVARREGQIALVPVYGVMAQRMSMMTDISGGTSTEMVAAQFRAALADSETKAIVLDMDTPGGASSGVAELADEIYDSRGIKPIIAQVNSTMASAGYWVGAAADEIVVTPGGQAGSIGVYTVHDDISEMLKQAGIKSTIIRNQASPHKVEVNDTEPLTEEIRGRVQKRIDTVAGRFVKAVARGRGVSQAAVLDRFGRGLMFDAGELVERGMADRIATLSETLERFGLSINPIASAARAQNVARMQAADALVAKLKAGDQLSPRELEHGLKGLAGLTNSEAERAVRLCFKGSAQGEPGKSTEAAVTKADFAKVRQDLDGIRQLLRA